MKIKVNIVAVLLLMVFLFTGCASYYQKNYQFQQQFASGNLEAAQAFLEKNKKAAEKKDRLLYFLDRGVVEQMLGNYETSNTYFEKAYAYNQNFQKSIGNDLVGYIANPMLQPYRAEDFEVILIHFYKSINYLQLNELDKALVEVRRVNISLNELNDKYEYRKNRYREDAFAHLLMGIIYEAKGDVNNAFIAYRNAYNTYSNDYQEEFATGAPQQLKRDLLRTAYKNGFRKELEEYENKFGFEYKREEGESGDLVFFWLNGLGPVKGEFNLNLLANKGNGGGVVFADEKESFIIPYSVNQSYYTSNPDKFSDLKVVRIAIPHYLKRQPLLNTGTILVNGEHIPLEKVEDINNIAFSTLQDRMYREIAKSVGRLAIKQAAELAAREKDEDIGALVGLLNAVTEKADTRNWQTLPYNINYQRVHLSPGKHTVKLATSGVNVVSDTVNFTIDIDSKETVFQSYHSLESTEAFKQ